MHARLLEVSVDPSRAPGASGQLLQRDGDHPRAVSKHCGQHSSSCQGRHGGTWTAVVWPSWPRLSSVTLICEAFRTGASPDTHPRAMQRCGYGEIKTNEEDPYAQQVSQRQERE